MNNESSDVSQLFRLINHMLMVSYIAAQGLNVLSAVFCRHGIVFITKVL